jgi:DNA-binding IclR family transcriptional regulator
LGYSVGISVNGQQVAIESVEGNPGVLDMGSRDRHRLAYIAASTFDERGEVSLVISFGGFLEPLTLEQIEGYAHRLRNAAAMITAAVHGSQPPSGLPPL